MKVCHEATIFDSNATEAYLPVVTLWKTLASAARPPSVIHMRSNSCGLEEESDRKGGFLCGLHKVCSHIMARADFLIYLSTRVERLSGGSSKPNIYALRTYF